MPFDGYTSGDLYGPIEMEWPDWTQDAPSTQCDCCWEHVDDHDQLVFDGGFGGLVCSQCRDEWWLASTSARRTAPGWAESRDAGAEVP
jgi:hypothetical protein